MTKSLFKIVFVIIYAFTIFGIFEISKGGGSCNGGLLFIVFIILFMITSLFLILSNFYFFRRHQLKKSFYFSLISFLVWSFGIICFYNSVEMIVYLIPLELLIIIWLFYIYSNNKKAIT